MALQLTKKIKGVDYNYWRVGGKGDDRIGNNINPALYLYLNKCTKDECCKNWVDMKVFHFEKPKDWEEKTGNEQLTLIYEMIKETEEFSEAEDI